LQINPAVEQNKNVNWSNSQWNRPYAKVKTLAMTWVSTYWT